MKSDGWDQLDTVRLFLASVVVVDHAVGIFLHPFGYASADVSWWLAVGAEWAVYAFFLISGLVIGRSLIRKSDEGDGLFLDFMWRRIARIYPPLLFSVALCILLASVLIVSGLDRYTGPATGLTRPAFSYLDNWSEISKSLLTFGFRGSLHGSSNGPLWSLTLEMQCYVISGLVAQAISARRTWVRAASIAGVLLAIRARGAQLPEIYQLWCFVCFAIGIGLSFMPLRFPRVLPVVPFDFSYSLYILHFPIMLFVFFLMCQGSPSLHNVILAVFVSLVTTVFGSITSGILLERQKNRQRRWFVTQASSGPSD